VRQSKTYLIKDVSRSASQKLRVWYENRSFNFLITRCRYCIPRHLKPLYAHKPRSILMIYFNIRLNFLS